MGHQPGAAHPSEAALERTAQQALGLRAQNGELIEHRVERDVVPIDVVGDKLDDVLVVRVVEVGDGHFLAVVRVDAPGHEVEPQLVHVARADGEPRLGRRENLGVHRDRDLGGEVGEVAHDRRG